MTTLIEEIERAEKGSFDIDVRIHANQLGADIARPAGGGYIFVIDGMQHGVSSTAIPCYTTSLDAALSLVPEGWMGQVHFGDKPLNPDGEKRYDAPDKTELWNGKYAPHNKEVDGCGADPALAICAAALRAIEAEREGK